MRLQERHPGRVSIQLALRVLCTARIVAKPDADRPPPIKTEYLEFVVLLQRSGLPGRLTF